MTKGLDLIARQQLEIIDGFPTGNIFIGVTKEELTELEKELKALDIFKEHELADTLFSYLKGDKTPANWNWGLPKKMQLTQEKWDLLREVIYGKDRVGD